MWRGISVVYERQRHRNWINEERPVDVLADNGVEGVEYKVTTTGRSAAPAGPEYTTTS